MTGEVRVVLPLACLAAGAFAVYLVARLWTNRNNLLALLTALVFATALGALVPLQLATGVNHLPAWGHFGPVGGSLPSRAARAPAHPVLSQRPAP